MTGSPYRYKVGELRPSQILYTFGIGSIADLPHLSVMVMGLDGWDKNPATTTLLSEPRLLAAVRRELGTQVKELCSPPIPQEDEESANPFDEAARIGVPVSPFPTWMVCPQCRLLAPLQSGLFELKSSPYRINETRYVHKNCPKSRKPPAVVPARFLVACQHGHLDDFPWHYFVHQGASDCQGVLRFEEYGVTGAASDIVVRCEGCQRSRRLSDAFGENGKQNMPKCRGRHPHLRDFDDECDQQMEAMLLGASNSWFPITLSALSIPLHASPLAQLVQKHWDILGDAPDPQTLAFSLGMAQRTGQLLEFLKYTHEEIWASIEQFRQGQNKQDHAQDLKTPEWQVLSLSVPTPTSQEFQLRPVSSPKGYEQFFTRTVLVERIREVRALIGFTRIQSPGDFDDTGEIPSEYRVRISRNAPSWVPASEVKGEGIFLQFNESQLQAWETSPAVLKRAQQTLEAQKRWLRIRNLDPAKIPVPSMRYVLIHSFSHALMRQLAIECGYNAASLRERLFAKSPHEEHGPQAGLLIYTAAPDSEGTLGGLVNLGEPDTLGYHISQALTSIRLCASDPLCADHDPNQGIPSLHWAACHACLFSPETSCERGNKYLDRSTLIPTFASDNLHFFALPDGEF